MKDEDKNNSQVSVNLNLDTTPILYTDNVIITTNDDGVVLDFCQRTGPNGPIRIVARIGMSREHGKKLLNSFGKQLALKEAQTQTSGKDAN